MRTSLSRSDIARLYELGRLREKGILSTEEFVDLKKALLASRTGESDDMPSRGGIGRLTTVAAAAALIILVVAFAVTSGRSAAYNFSTAQIAQQR